MGYSVETFMAAQCPPPAAFLEGARLIRRLRRWSKRDPLAPGGRSWKNGAPKPDALASTEACTAVEFVWSDRSLTSGPAIDDDVLTGKCGAQAFENAARILESLAYDNTDGQVP